MYYTVYRMKEGLNCTLISDLIVSVKDAVLTSTNYISFLNTLYNTTLLVWYNIMLLLKQIRNTETHFKSRAKTTVK